MSSSGRSMKSTAVLNKKLHPVLAVFLVLLTCLAPVVVFEIIMQKGLLSEEIKILEDPDHRPVPNENGKNSDGLRTDYDPETFKAEDVNVVVLGDSFVYGYLLKQQQALPQRLEDMARATYPNRSIRVVNFGWISASPYLQLRQLRDIGARYKPDTVLLCLDVSDFHDDHKYRALIERPDIYKLTTLFPATFVVVHRALKTLAQRVPSLIPLYERIFRLPIDRFFAVNQPLERSKGWLNTTRDLIDAIRRYSEETLGARFALVLLPRGFQYSADESPYSWESDEYTPLGPFVREPFHYFEAPAPERSYPVFSLLPDFEKSEVFPTCFINDPHWNEAGTDLAARAILRRCEKMNCFANRRPRGE